MKINLNDMVKIKPTEYCWSILTEKFSWIKNDKVYSHIEPIDFAKEYYKWDREFLTMQLWEVCNLFGESFCMGNNNLPIDTDIEILNIIE